MRMIGKGVIVFVVALLLQKNAHAYLDPGTGSYLLQLLAGALLGSLFMVKIFFSKIKAFFQNLFSKGTQNGDNGSKTNNS